VKHRRYGWLRYPDIDTSFARDDFFFPALLDKVSSGGDRTFWLPESSEKRGRLPSDSDDSLGDEINY
jgi:hypothetical protein